jgi:aldehyde dehydrogenase (NAD+)
MKYSDLYLYLNTLVMIYIYDSFRYENHCLYTFFTENKIFAEKIIQNYSLEEVYKWHNNSFLNKRLPFGGVGHSGIGAYHGALVWYFSHKSQ